MAHTSPSQWKDFEQFNVSFERVASGWEAVDPEKAVSDLRKTLGIRVREVQPEPERGRLFVVGNFGALKPEKAITTLQLVAGALKVAGTPRVKVRGRSFAGEFVKTEQYVGKLPVYGTELTLHLDTRGIGYAITGSPMLGKPEIAKVSKKISPKGAVEVVARALRTSIKETTFKVAEILLPTPDEFQPCYQVKVFTWKPFGTWYGFVGTDHRLLALYNVASAAVGEANGYAVSPLRGPLTRLRLDDLAELRYLSSGHSEVWHHGRKRVSSKDGTFLFSNDASEFDQPQLYYSLTTCRTALAAVAGAELANTVFREKPFNPTVGTVHVPEAVNNAFYSPLNSELFFGDIELDPERRYTSRSLDIVLHEYGHGVSDAICRLGRTRPHTESRAMSEGYSDYFAATFLDNPVIGDYFVNAPQGFRNCANNKRFPRGYAGEEHDVGEIWAGFLWTLRNEPSMGKGIADALVLQSLSYLGPWRTIRQGLEAVLEADRLLFPAGNTRGRHEDAIRSAFDARQP